MEFLGLLRRESDLNLRQMVGIALIAGLSNAMVLVVISAAADPHARVNGTKLLAVTFCVVLLAYSLSQRYLMSTASKEIERIIHRVRHGLIAAVRDSALPDIERIGQSRIYNAIGRETQSLAQNTNTLVAVSQMSLLVIFATLYLLILSPTAFAIAVIFMGLAITIYLSRLKVVNSAMKNATGAELTLHELLMGIIDGFKETRLNALRAAQISNDILAASLEAGDARMTAQSELTRNYIFMQNVFFLLIATVIFIVPDVTDIELQAIAKMTTAILFVASAIAGVVSSVQTIVNANTSAKTILHLRRCLGLPRRISCQNSAPTLLPASFKRIDAHGLTFRYGGEASTAFSVGPFNFSLHAGEILLISGGNGSGKSTFMRLLTSLYWPTDGFIAVDGQRVTQANVERYRALFATVFSEYHLFRRLYGVDLAAQQEGAALMHLFEMDDKTAIVDGAFHDVALSTAQRRRLALIVALLEQRPICVLDEWAVDQDPLFRRKFYEQLLPLFRARGLTVVAVSHDDHYFDVADRRFHMEEGKIVAELRKSPS